MQVGWSFTDRVYGDRAQTRFLGPCSCKVGCLCLTLISTWMEYSKFLLLLHVVIWFFLSNICYGTESDIQCLKRIRASLNDPNGYLSTWNLTNPPEGSICKYSGIECWHPDENRVINLRLSNMGLEGQFPLGIENCSSLTGLDLSNNNLSGLLPSDICSRRTKFVTTLDLSSNRFSGEIPVDLGNCTYLDPPSL